MVDATTFHLQSTQNSRLIDYSDRFSKGKTNYLNTQIFQFLENINKARLRVDTLKFNNMQFHEWQIIDYFKNWHLLLFVKDNFTYKNFSERLDLDIEDSWTELNSRIYIRHFLIFNYIQPTLKKIKNKKSTFISAMKSQSFRWIPYLDLSLGKILLYLNFIFYRLPLILETKKFIYNFIFFNFFRSEFHYNKKLQIIFCITSEESPSSFLISQFISKKLIERFSVSLVLRRVLSYMLGYYKRNLIDGFRIFVKGRVTRKERMTYKWQKRGKLSLNSKFAPIDFFNRTMAARYGTCSVQVWIQK